MRQNKEEEPGTEKANRMSSGERKRERERAVDRGKGLAVNGQLVGNETDGRSSSQTK